MKAQGLLHSLKSGQQINSFLVAKNSLEMVEPLATKLQKKDQDILLAYNMIDQQLIMLKNYQKLLILSFRNGIQMLKENQMILGVKLVYYVLQEGRLAEQTQ